MSVTGIMADQSTPSVIQAIQATMYGGVPDEPELLALVVPVVTLLKLATLAICVAKYPTSQYQPFNAVVYLYGGLGALAKLVNFYAVTHSRLTLILEDISFSTALIGVTVTTSTDFLWALSTAVDSNPIFKRNISEGEFVKNLWRWQPLVVVYLVGVRHLPMFSGSILSVHVNYSIMLQSAFLFIWYCLWLVAGNSTTKKFQSAYKKAFIVNTLTHAGALLYSCRFIPLFYDTSLAGTFIAITHFLESSVTLLTICYFAFMKAPPADLQKKKTNWAQMAGVLKARDTLKKKAKSN